MTKISKTRHVTKKGVVKRNPTKRVIRYQVSAYSTLNKKRDIDFIIKVPGQYKGFKHSTLASFRKNYEKFTDMSGAFYGYDIIYIGKVK